MLTSFPTLQVKDVYDTDLYASHLIFKMDKAGFDLGYEQKVRRVSLRIHYLYMRQGHPPVCLRRGIGQDQQLYHAYVASGCL